jgi:hypothetical protein
VGVPADLLLGGLPHVAADPRLVRAAAWALVHFVWQGALGAGLLWLGLAGCRQARSRYALSCAALLAMTAAPPVTAWYMMRGPSVHASAVTDTPTATRSIEATGRAGRTVEEVGRAGEPGPIGRIVPRLFRGGADGARGVVRRAVDAFSPWLLAAWALGVALLSLRFAGGWMVARRMATQAVGRVPAEWEARFQRLAHAVRVGVRVRLLQSARVAAPTVVGWLRPVVLLPASALTGLPAEQLELLLLHELAHVRRHDFAVNLLQCAAETLLFYHPGVWWVSRRIREEREHCCDDLAVRHAAGAPAYIAALAAMEGLRARVPAPALGADGGTLLARCLRLAGRTPPPTARAGLWLPAALILGGLVLLPRPAPTTASTLDPPSHLSMRPAFGGPCDVNPSSASTVCEAANRTAAELLARTGVGGAVVVQDVRTGALVSYAAAPGREREADVMSAALPASVWKLLLAALWWDAGLGDRDVPCPARLMVDGATFTSAGAGDAGPIRAPAEMLVRSCNTAAAGMAVQLRGALGPRALLDGYRRFGLSMVADGDAAPSGPDTAFWAGASADWRKRMSPAPALVRIGEDDAPETWARMALGAARVQVSPLHVSRFLQAVGNDGVMLAPTADRATAERPLDGRRVMQPRTALRLRGAMLDVVERGTASAVRPLLAGSAWRLGGKTGTAPRRGAAKPDGWFAGLVFDPSGAPRYTVVAYLRGGGSGGGEPARVAAGMTRFLAGSR